MADFRFRKVKSVSFDTDDISNEQVPHGELLSRLTEFLPNKNYDHPLISDSDEFKLSSDDLSIELSDTYIPPSPPSVSKTRFPVRTRVDTLNVPDTKKDFPQVVPKLEDKFSPPPQPLDPQAQGYSYHPILDVKIPETFFPTELKVSTEDLSKEIVQTYLPPLSSGSPPEDQRADRGKTLLETEKKFPTRVSKLEENFPFLEHPETFHEVNNADTPLKNNHVFRDKNVQQKTTVDGPFFVPTFRVKSDEIEISKEFLDSLEVKHLNRFTPVLDKSKKQQFSFPNNFPRSKSIHQFKESKENIEFGLKSNKNFPNGLSEADSKAFLPNEFREFHKDFVEFDDPKSDNFRKLIEQKGFSDKASNHAKVDNKTASLIFVLLGSLSPLLQLGNQSASPHLTNYLKQDVPASVIHIPRLTANHQFQEQVNPIDSLPKSLAAKSFSEALTSSLDLETCTKEYFTFKCNNIKDEFCLEDPNYPLSDIIKFAKNDPILFRKYAEVPNQSADELVSSIQKKQEEDFDYSKFNPFVYDETHWFGPEGYVCPSNVTYGRPIRALNANGQWKFIVNDEDSLTQTLRLETCLYTDAPCRLIAPCFKSKCVQKYSFHRLLSFDPCEPSKGIHNDIFRLPSACSCYAPEFHSFDDLLSIEIPNKQMIGKPLIN